MNIVGKLVSTSWRPGRAALAGIVALGVYTAEMEVDMAVTRNHFSDVHFIEGLLPGKTGKWEAKNRPLLAWGIHLVNGVMLAELYAAVIKRLLPGPDWLRGVIFGEAFIVSVWWLTPLADKYHPLIKRGVLPPLANWTSFLQNIVRHFFFGLTLGLLYRER
ncbi:MAG TPA: DUF6789 family protein [Ktedonobacteraceae bacterium]|jgi:hypothetical protein|nr:DUF6789 family protein [Ktedonobacteraceae bacterium]